LYASFSNIGGYHNIFSRQTADPLWKAARKGSAPAFASHEVSRMNQVCREHLQQWIAAIPDDDDQGWVFDPSADMIRLTFFIVMESAFEYAPTEEEYTSFVAELELALREFVFRQSVNPLRRMFAFLIPEARRAVQACRKCRVLGQRVLDSYRSNPHKSTHNTLIKLIDENPAFAGNDPLKVSELVTYLTAGFDTTGYTLSSTLVLLAQHPEAVKKARDSMIGVAAKGGATMMTDTIHHILAESNRLYPVAAMGSSRFVPRDMTVFDQKSQRHYVIPKGSNCCLPQYLANRNPVIFGEDADEFRPDRWINASPAMTDAKLMFSLGNRNCIGQSLALAELHSVLPRLIQHYRLELIEPGHLDYFLTLKFHGAKIKLTKIAVASVSA
jgi:cytochrome P450